MTEEIGSESGGTPAPARIMLTATLLRLGSCSCGRNSGREPAFRR